MLRLFLSRFPIRFDSFKEIAMRTLPKWLGFAATALFVATSAHAQVTVGDPWVRATVPQQNGTGAFMRLTSETPAALVQADSPVAKYVEIHEMAMENNVMKMRQIPRIDLPAGKPVELKPGGYHIMLIDLHGQVKEGEQVPLTLTFESADGVRSSVEVQAPVKPLATPSGNAGHHGAAAHQGAMGHQGVAGQHGNAHGAH